MQTDLRLFVPWIPGFQVHLLPQQCKIISMIALGSVWCTYDLYLTFFLEDVLMNSWSCTQVSRCLFRVSRQKGKVKAKDPTDSKAIFLSKPISQGMRILPQPHGNVHHWRCIWPRHHLYEFGWCTSTDSIPGRTCKVLTLAGGFWRFFHGMDVHFFPALKPGFWLGKSFQVSKDGCSSYTIVGTTGGRRFLLFLNFTWFVFLCA